MVFAWFVVFLILLIIELVTINLISIWFVIGALAAMITTFFTDSIIIQTIVFIIISLIALIITKPLVKKMKNSKVEPTNSDRVIGKIGEVTKKIKKNEYGEIKVYGNTWTASSDEVLDVGEKVRVLSIDGVKLIVKKEDD